MASRSLANRMVYFGNLYRDHAIHSRISKPESRLKSIAGRPKSRFRSGRIVLRPTTCLGTREPGGSCHLVVFRDPVQRIEGFGMKQRLAAE